MTGVRPTVVAACTALLLAAPAAAAGSPTAVERALAQERAYTQQTNPGRSITTVDRALAQERTYAYTPNADRGAVSTATADGGVSTAVLAGSIAGLLLATVGALALIAAHRRHVHDAAASLQP
jgi:hypothetical protein